MDYYSILGVSKSASEAEIRKAYKKQSMKHHPDRGGDEEEFKKINEAYQTLSDPQKKQIYDMGGNPHQQRSGGFNQGPFEFHFGGGPGMEDIFNHFGFGFQNPRQRAKNKDISINLEITLQEVLTGKDFDAQISTQAVTKDVHIKVPPGVENGQSIKYQGIGDNSIKNLPPGDLIVNIYVKPHQVFTRSGDTITCEKRISVWDAILGGSITVETLTGRELTITIPKGIQPETILNCKEEGLPNIRTRRRGSLHVKIKIDIPKNLTEEQLEKIKDLKYGI